MVRAHGIVRVRKRQRLFRANRLAATFDRVLAEQSDCASREAIEILRDLSA